MYYQNPVDIYQTQNGRTQNNGIPNSCRGCNKNLSSDNPASQYQRQKLIQKTVRVPSSLYTMNLAGLSAYQKPSNEYQTVEQAGTPYVVPSRTYWNQMSDRAKPSVQVTKTGSGSGYRCSSTKHTIVRHRPGALSPGGVGVDIKHNSYDRYLNKLKGKAPLRRGIIPPNYGQPIIYNQAYPITGGKTVKTSIVNGCECPDIKNKGDDIIYGPISNALQDIILSVTYNFRIGDLVWAKKINQWYKAQIIDISNNDTYTIKFLDNDETMITNKINIIPYFDCDCVNQSSFIEKLLETKDKSQYTVSDYILYNAELDCKILNLLTTGEIL